MNAKKLETIEQLAARLQEEIAALRKESGKPKKQKQLPKTLTRFSKKWG